MAKLTILSATLLLALAVSTTLAHRTTTITIEEEAENPHGGQSCQEQVQRQWQQLQQHCSRYMSPRRSPFNVMAIEANPKQQEEQYLRQCCQQLQNLDEQCRCEAVQEILRQTQQEQQREGREGEFQGERMREVIQKARYLPSKCNLRPQECQIN